MVQLEAADLCTLIGAGCGEGVTVVTYRGGNVLDGSKPTHKEGSSQGGGGVSCRPAQLQSTISPTLSPTVSNQPANLLLIRG